LFPISDDNPRVRFPLATVVLIALNALAWVGVQGLGDHQALAASLCHYALVPGELLGNVPAGTMIPVGQELACELSGAPRPTTLITSMFMHGGWFHILGNMWFLWIFGDNVEDELGPVRFTLFYLVCGLAAAFAQALVNPQSLLPMVGASGAIGGVMGAYALLFPKVRVRLLIILGFYVTTISVPAIYMLGYWFLLQLLQGIPALGTDQGGVAFWAHMGGFLAGLALAWVFRRAGRSGRGSSRSRGGGERGRWF
jgi:membrane associated rhomboid family serine protease